MNRFTAKLGLFSVLIALVALPAAAHAADNNPTGGSGSGGCVTKDKDGNDIPLDDGQTVFVDGHLATCHSGTVVITTANMTTQTGTKKPPKKVIIKRTQVKTVSSVAKR